MTQEDKELLLTDLCARLPYGVNIQYDNGHIIETRELGLGSLHDFIFNDVAIKPYLRPMSSMTEKEKKEIKALGAEFSSIGSIRFRIKEDENDGFEYGYKWIDILDWLNKKGFDYRELIPKGLALEAPKNMYKI